jgi:hypothetical protein
LAYKYLKETSTLNSGDTQSGGDVLSGFEHPVAEVFEQNPGETVETREKTDQAGVVGSDRE